MSWPCFLPLAASARLVVRSKPVGTAPESASMLCSWGQKAGRPREHWEETLPLEKRRCRCLGACSELNDNKRPPSNLGCSFFSLVGELRLVTCTYVWLINWAQFESLQTQTYLHYDLYSLRVPLKIEGFSNSKRFWKGFRVINQEHRIKARF